MSALWIAVALVALVLLYAIYLFNRLVSLRNRVDNGWSQIDVQLRRRYDLIPNLVQTVKGYAAHERELFEHVAEARSRAIGASTVGDQAQAENQLTAGLRRLMAVANYNTDIADFWEFSATGFRPVDESNEAYKIGVNYIMYGMTH